MKSANYKFLPLWIIAVLLIVCSAAWGSDYDRDEKITDYTNEIISSFGDSQKEIQAKFGKPVKVESEKTQNEHDPDITDTIISLEYEGIDFGLFESGYPEGGACVISMNCTSQKFKLEHFNVGDRTDEVRKQLGEPNGKGTDHIHYDSDFAILIIYHDKNNVITGISGGIFLD